MNETTFATATIAELGAALRAGTTTPTELAELSLGRLERTGRALNAVATLTPEIALREAAQAEADFAAGLDRGPLHGIPYGAKDLLATIGTPTTWGAVPFRHQQFDRDAAVIERLREAGAVLTAKLSMVELAGGFGYEQPTASLTGPGRCAWNRDTWSGGSSSGSGSAVAAGCVPFAIGTETWGSIHCPSSFNGLTGLRPTIGRVSRRGAMALCWTLDKIGPMARSAVDAGVVLHAIEGPDPGDPFTMPQPVVDVPAATRKTRLGIHRRSLEHAQPGVVAAFEGALGVLAEFAELIEIELPDLPWEELITIVLLAEAASAFEEFIIDGRAAELTAPEDRTGLLHALALPAVDYLRAMRVRGLGMRRMDGLLAEVDAVIAPSMPIVAPPIDQSFELSFPREARRTLGAAGNACGLPSITVPCGFGDRDLPVGLEFLGRAWSESRITAIAHEYQTRTSWHQQHPNFS